MTTLDKLIEVGAMAAWKPISEAPYNTPVRVKVGNMTLIARLLPDASMSSLETSCDQWQAEHDGEHPPCWSGGACWESNEDETESLQPTAWQPLDSERAAILAILPLIADDLAGVAQGQYSNESRYHEDSPFYGSDLTPDRSEMGRRKQAGRTLAAQAIRTRITALMEKEL